MGTMTLQNQMPAPVFSSQNNINILPGASLPADESMRKKHKRKKKRKRQEVNVDDHGNEAIEDTGQSQPSISSTQEQAFNPTEEQKVNTGEEERTEEIRRKKSLQSHSAGYLTNKQRVLSPPYSSASKASQTRPAPVLLPRKHGKIRKELPVYGEREKIVQSIMENQVVIIIGETGSGKTTQTPQFLMEKGFTSQGKLIGVTQPRRVAAITVAKRVAEEVGTRLGELVGYSIRFDDCTTPWTKLKFLTDGMLLREAMLDPELSRYSVVMLDEAHERSLNTDILMGILKPLARRRKDLKIVIMSATIDVDLFSSFFPGALSLYVQGRQYPVDVYYTQEPQLDYLDAVLISVLQIHLEEDSGDILAFLTGQEEIEALQQLLEEKGKQLPPESAKLRICPLYAAMPPQQQLRVFEPAERGERKVILATNIAETSLTINGIKYVIDPGLVKVRSYNPKNGMDALQITEISKAQAQQRAGRAGRESAGKCFRLYQEKKFLELRPNIIPEIKRINLSSVVLQLKSLNIDDIIGFDFLEKPSKEALGKALERLYALEALGEDGKLTEMGRKMARFPVDPMYAKMLLKSVDFGCSEEALTIVSLLSVENIFFSPKEKREKAAAAKKRFASYDGDCITLLNVYKAFRQMKGEPRWCYENFVNVASMKTAESVRKQLVEHFRSLSLPLVSCSQDNEVVRKAIVSGFFLNCAKRMPKVEGGGGQGKAAYKSLCTGQLVSIHPSSVLFSRSPPPQCVVYNELVVTSRQYMRGVTTIDPQWLPEVAPRFFKGT